MYCVGLPYCDDETHLATERTVEANDWNMEEGGGGSCQLHVNEIVEMALHEWL